MGDTGTDHLVQSLLSFGLVEHHPGTDVRNLENESTRDIALGILSYLLLELVPLELEELELTLFLSSLAKVDLSGALILEHGILEESGIREADLEANLGK